MPGEGSMLHAINTIRANRALRRSKRRKFRNETRTSTSKNSTKRNVNSFKKDMSKEDLSAVKEQIRIQIRKDQKRYFVISIMLFSLFVFILSFFWKYIF